MRTLEDINEAHSVIHDAGGLVIALQELLRELNGKQIPKAMQDVRTARHALVAVGNALEHVFKDIEI